MTCVNGVVSGISSSVSQDRGLPTEEDAARRIDWIGGSGSGSQNSTPPATQMPNSSGMGSDESAPKRNHWSVKCCKVRVKTDFGVGNSDPDHCFSFKTALTTAFLTVRNECGGQVIPDHKECQNHSRWHINHSRPNPKLPPPETETRSLSCRD